MNEARAREELGESIQPNGDLYCLGHYTSWRKGDKNICLDDDFTLAELKAIVWWMENTK